MRSNQQDLLPTMVESLTTKLDLALSLCGGDLEAAIAKVKDETCAGPRAWAIVLAKHNRPTPPTATG